MSVLSRILTQLRPTHQLRAAGCPARGRGRRDRV